jgi:phenylacetate-CoA ligase
MHNIPVNKVKDHLMYISENVKYYEAVMMDLSNDNSIINSFLSLPYTSKKIMLMEPDLFMNQKMLQELTAPNLIQSYTSGTTGQPFLISKTAYEKMLHYKNIWSSRKEFEIKPSDFYYEFGGIERSNGVPNLKYVIDKGHRMEFSMFHMNNEIIDMYIEIISEGKGNWILTTPSAIYLVALRMRERGIKKLGNIKYIEFFAERLFDYQEKLVKEVFGCETGMLYGSREITAISHRCKYGCNHVVPNIFVELYHDPIMSENKNLGELVITSFIDKLMPFVRYRTGDLGSLSYKDDCPCGRQGIVIDEIHGRTEEYINVNGNKLHMEITYYIIDKYNSLNNYPICQFQVVYRQKENKMCFRLVLNSGYHKDENIYSFFKNEIDKVEKSIQVEIEYVDVIERLKIKSNPFVIE